MANSFKEFIKEYDKAQKKKAAELETLKFNLAAAETKRDEAKKDFDKAMLGDSDAAFTDAKVELMKAETKVEYYQIKIKQCKDRPLFNVSNEAKLKEIASLQRSIEDAACENALNPIREAFYICRDANARITKLNEIAGELSGDGVNYLSPHFYKISKLMVLRDQTYKLVK